jgi:Na+/proline symporter
MPFQNLAAFGTDQLNAQRIFCCGSPQEARKAMVWSSVSIVITMVMLAVGAGLFAWYGMKGLSADEAAAFASDPNKVFPVWITTVLPPGLTGLILAGAFAAAISSLDSVLAALSQTSLSAIYGRGKMEDDLHGKKMVARSRIAVVIWAGLLSWFAIAMAKGHEGGENKNLITLAFGMVAYTYPPLLGVLLAAILPGRKSVAGLFVGTALSIILVLWTRPELAQLLGWMQVEWSWLEASRPKIASEWFFPLNALLTLVCGYAGAWFTAPASGSSDASRA